MNRLKFVFKKTDDSELNTLDMELSYNGEDLQDIIRATLVLDAGATIPRLEIHRYGKSPVESLAGFDYVEIETPVILEITTEELEKR